MAFFYLYFVIECCSLLVLFMYLVRLMNIKLWTVEVTCLLPITWKKEMSVLVISWCSVDCITTLMMCLLWSFISIPYTVSTLWWSAVLTSDFASCFNFLHVSHIFSKTGPDMFMRTETRALLWLMAVASLLSPNQFAGVFPQKVGIMGLKPQTLNTHEDTWTNHRTGITLHHQFLGKKNINKPGTKWIIFKVLPISVLIRVSIRIIC